MDGPEVYLEFSRKSQSRSGALTLVIDPIHGAGIRVAYALSTRTEPGEAINDLRRREGTSLANIGRFFTHATEQNHCRSAALNMIGEWARTNEMDVVIWTDLTSDFEATPAGEFVQTAVRYIQDLSPLGKARAAEYIWRAPDFVRTPLREVLQKQPWFREAKS